MARRQRLRPFTVAHFRAYTERLILDNGEPWELEDFQADIVRDIFKGYPEVWVVLPEGNAKTTLMAGVALYGADYTPRPWIPIGAASRDQAEIMYGQAASFVRDSPGMLKRFAEPQDGYRRIMSLRNGGRGIKVYAADKKTGDGPIPTPYCFVDEGGRQRDLGLYRTWKGKLRKRQDRPAQIIMTSVAGEPGSDFEVSRDRIRDRAVKRQRRGGRLRAEGHGAVLIEYKVPSLETASDLKAVKAANPLSAITVKDLRAKRDSPTLDYGEDWVRMTCNIPARSSRAAITDKEWDEAETRVRIPEGALVDVGLDIAWKWDTTAIVPLWWKSRKFRLFGDPHILVPPRDGTMLSSHRIKAAFEAIKARNPIRFVVLDPEKGEEIAQWLEGELGIEAVLTYGNTDQPASLAYERFMEGLREGWIKHTGHKEFRQHVMNAIVLNVQRDRQRFDRPKSSRHDVKQQDLRVIDALTAAAGVHSVVVAEANEEPPPPFNLADYRIQQL